MKFLTTGKDLTLRAQGDSSDVVLQLSAGRTVFLPGSSPRSPARPEMCQRERMGRGGTKKTPNFTFDFPSPDAGINYTRCLGTNQLSPSEVSLHKF